MSYNELNKFLNVKKLRIGEKTLSYPCLEDMMEHDAAVNVLNDFHPGLEFSRVRSCTIRSEQGTIVGNFGGSLENYKRVFVNSGWEGLLKSVVGIELNNILSDRPVPYILYQSVIVSSEIKGKTLSWDWISGNMENYAYEWGVLNEFSRVIGLDDRTSRNIIICEDKLWNIDFGQSFSHDSSKGLDELELLLPRPPMGISQTRISPNIMGKIPQLIEAGEEYGSSIIKGNIEDQIKKLMEIFACIDEWAFTKMQQGYIVTPEKKVYHPGDILLKYVSDKGWEELARELQKVNQ